MTVRLRLGGMQPLPAAAAAMKIAARLLTLLAAISFLPGCRHRAALPPARTDAGSPPPAAQAELLSPSPRLAVGRVLAVDQERRFAIVDLISDPPRDALMDGTELITRTFVDLRETARLRASRYTRGRTLGTTILAGQPAIGDEVVWLAP